LFLLLPAKETSQHNESRAFHENLPKLGLLRAKGDIDETHIVVVSNCDVLCFCAGGDEDTFEAFNFVDERN